jgi:hypothetical protein
MLAKGWIRPSKSSVGALLLCAPKKDGGIRVCVDYRGLNAIFLKNRYPLPLIDEIITRLSGAKFFTQLDLRDAYHRIRIAKGHEWKTAFRTKYGLFEYLVVPFRLTNAPATFQAYVNWVFRDLLDITVVVYLDDIIMFSQDMRSHQGHVREVLRRLREAGLYYKRSKCTFTTQQINFLGYIITPKGVEMEPSRVATIQDWPMPEIVRDILAFLGFANWYRWFIRSYASIIVVLTDLLRKPKDGPVRTVKDKGSVMTLEARAAVNLLKEKFAEMVSLNHFAEGLSTRLEIDALGGGLCGVLTQLHPDGMWRLVAFVSRKLS